MNVEEVELSMTHKYSTATISEADTDSSEENEIVDDSPFTLTDGEISAKLTAFAGADRGLDEDTEKVVGKLLLEDKDENVNADKETFSKLFKMIGGFFTLSILATTTCAFKYFDLYK